MNTTAQALYYLVYKLGKVEKNKLLNLLYLADKLHLIRYGRTITGDKYYATKNGFEGKRAKAILRAVK